jgi:hypothetical protein
MAPKVRAGDADAAAKGIRRSAARLDARSGADPKDRTPLSPTIEGEIRRALDLLQGTRKVEGVAWDLGLSRSVYYERVIDHPLTLTVEQLLTLLVLCPDPRFNARLRQHFAALDAYQAVAEARAGETYIRITTGQRALFGGGR